MRDLDKRAVMTGDFVVVYGDAVSNFPLHAALAAHRARRALDKNAIMTMVLREAGAEHRTKAHGFSPLFAIDPSKKRCVHYEQISSSIERAHSHIELDPELLSTHKELELRNDLIDCGIDICTPDVLALWSDNFDYEAPRKGFLHSVLKDYELNGKTVHTYISKNHYAARVRNLLGYRSVSLDIVSRWSYPFCPDSNLMEGQTYTLTRRDIFKENDVKISRSAVIGPKTVVGSKTTIGTGSVVSDSIIGRNCTIGKDCNITGAFLWDNTVIGDCTTLENCVIANNVVIGKHCRVLPGALISYGVRLSDGILVQQERRVSRAKNTQGKSQRTREVKIVGESGEGYAYEPSDDEDQEDEAAAGIMGLGMKRWSRSDMNGVTILTDAVYNKNFSISQESVSTLHSDTIDENDDNIPRVQRRRSTTGSFMSVASDENPDQAHAEHFHHDAAGSIYDGLQRGHDVSTIQLELQGLRMAANASEHQIRRAVVSAMMKHVVEARKAGIAVKEVFTKNKMLVERTIFDKDEEKKTDQVDFLLMAQTELSRRPEGDAVLLAVCNELYLADVLEEAGFEQWWENEKSVASEEMRNVRMQTEKLVKTLTEDSESESESEEEDDSDEEEDEDSDDE